MSNREKFDEFWPKYKKTAPPVDIDGLCRDIGIEVIKDYDMSNVEKHFGGRQIDGAILHDGTEDAKDKGRWFILVNYDASETRKRFTIAHELGHFVLHCEEKPKKPIISFRGGRGPQETQANNFAAETLMPADILFSICKSIPFVTPSYLAAQFQVSREAARIRLDKLGLGYIDL